MKQQLRIFSISLIIAILGLNTALGQEASRLGGKLTCNGPVSNKDTGESLYSRYGEDATLNTFQDRNYDSFIVVELFSGDADLIVKLEDNDFVKNVAAVEVWSNGTAWSVEGLKIGMTVEEVATINGGPFKLKMTDYDLVADGAFAGGRLDKLDGDCRLRVAFMIPNDIKVPKSINMSVVSSDHPDLLKARPVVTELSLQWPRK